MIERFALADELTCYYDSASEPANVHLEAWVADRLDPTAVRAAVSDVLGSQPRIMARRRPARWRRGYYWEFPVPATADPVRTAEYAGQEDLDRQRDAFLSESPSLDGSPPLRFLHASGPDGDCLILNAHHAAFDGLSCLRLIREVAAAYSARAGEQDLASRADPPAASAVTAVTAAPAEAAAPAAPAVTAEDRTPMAHRVSSKNPNGPLVFYPATATAATGRAGESDGRGPAARIAPGPGGLRGRPGYGAHLLSWDGLAVAGPLRSAGVSVNDVLIAALMVTIGDWNESHGGNRDQIKITMPVGDKAQAGREGHWANMSRLTTVAARVPAGTWPADLVVGVASQTRAAKTSHGPQLDLGSRVLAAAPLPVTVKHVVLRSALRIAGPLLCDTSLVSNLGVVDALAFGATPATEVWFSTSAHMPRGLSLGAVTAGGALRLTFRYRRALMSGADAAEFGGRYLKALDQIAGQEAVRS